MHIVAIGKYLLVNGSGDDIGLKVKVYKAKKVVVDGK